MTTTANIAAKFNVLESAIVRVEEWKSVMFAVIKGIGARFVSKKLKVEEKKVKIDGVVKNSGKVEIFRNNSLNTVEKIPGSNKFSSVNDSLEEGEIVFFDGYFISPYSKKELNGWFQLYDGKLISTEQPIARTSSPKKARPWFDEIYEELNSPTTYAGNPDEM